MQHSYALFFCALKKDIAGKYNFPFLSSNFQKLGIGCKKFCNMFSFIYTIYFGILTFSMANVRVQFHFLFHFLRQINKEMHLNLSKILLIVHYLPCKFFNGHISYEYNPLYNDFAHPRNVKFRVLRLPILYVLRPICWNYLMSSSIVMAATSDYFYNLFVQLFFKCKCCSILFLHMLEKHK